MNIDHAADLGVLENIHALNDESLGQFQLIRQSFHLRRAGKASENRVEIMHGVPDLVERVK